MSDKIIVAWKPIPTDVVYLTERQTQILKAIGEAKHTKEIASKLKLTPKGVEWHSQKLKRTLGIHPYAPLWPIALRVFGKEKSP